MKIFDLMVLIRDVENISFINMLIKTYQTKRCRYQLVIACSDSICLSCYRVFVI